MQHQRGAVLVVSLIFLLIITAIAIASMTGGTLETVMVSNAQQRESIFRVAESAVEQTLSLNAYNKALAKPEGEHYDIPDVTSAVDDSTAAAELEYMKKRIPFGGWQLGSYGVFVYEARGKAETDDERIGSQVTQGVAIMLPTPQD